MMLKDTTIKSRDSLKECFSIEKQYEENICIKLLAYKDFVFKYLQPMTAVDALLFKRVGEDGRYAFPANEPKWLDEDKLDMELLIEDLAELARPHCTDFTAPPNAARIRRLAQPVASREEAALLYLLMLLHIQARHCLDDSDMDYMAEKLEQVRTEHYKRNYVERTSCEVPVDQWQVEKTICPEGSRCVEQTVCNGLAVRVVRSGTKQARTLYYGESVLTLHLAGRLPIFLPRMRGNMEDEAVQAYCTRLLRAFSAAPQEENEQLVPIMDDDGCAGWLTDDGRVLVQGREVAVGALDAAADKDYIFLAMEDGVALLPRSAEGDMRFLAKTLAPVEEVDVHGGKVFWRISNESALHSLNITDMEDGQWH